ncbi:uncharacterized protein B0I36DRAFT_326672 [Microdochium trichocladiopsis]|uniref:Secreted protein n=1 Tax=Microdochium trichocladiopsis TaxID=1682393 RepID=A0A9P8Y153_9PEZI|nr:uncharacterized protein B0I36DRAFT_326672 [Microdochium trichocladiopsis]KAH7027211.1 hypothetical protein B0I36DRAFT_326672 [Microdochium trichocladiopsis]
MAAAARTTTATMHALLVVGLARLLLAVGLSGPARRCEDVRRLLPRMAQLLCRLARLLRRLVRSRPPLVPARQLFGSVGPPLGSRLEQPGPRRRRCPWGCWTGSLTPMSVNRAASPGPPRPSSRRSRTRRGPRSAGLNMSRLNGSSTKSSKICLVNTRKGTE